MATTTAPRLVVEYQDETAAITATAERILLALGDLQAADPTGSRRVDIAVTGGGDGIETLAVMGDSPLLESIDWTRVHIWWGDERFVPVDDDDRNAKQARQALFDDMVARGLLPAANIHEMPADQRPAEVRASASDQDNQAATDAAGAKYEQELKAQLGPEPRLDIALFGVGPDGHFASLFPSPRHSEISIADQRLAVGAIDSPRPPALRVTLTVPMIQRSHQLFVIATRAEKAEAMQAALGMVNNPLRPVSFAAGSEATVWMADAAALGH